MGNCPDESELTRLLDGELAATRRAAVEAHVDECPDCQRELDRLTREEAESTSSLGRMIRLGPAIEAQETWDHVVERIAGLDSFPPGPREGCAAAEEAWPRIEGYEILGELGRGGMAVVFRARHVGLGRVVALKMLLLGRRHDEGSRDRLREEARTLARLRHPNIVKVYDIGEHDGLPFFSLELVEGTSLSRWMDGLPQDPRLAARVVMKIAIAIDYAHRNGVLHRDLSPANVLIGHTTGAESEGEEPPGDAKHQVLMPPIKVSDFGLAKVLDDLGTPAGPRTEPGLIVGTPQYMAPEQARLTGEAIGPGADVYALGAIFYELLAGHPPFPAETPLKTLFRVVHEQPSPLTINRPRLPRDLVTICTKCMEKETPRRYPTAAAVAEDLRRYLASEAILARPAGTLGRLARWIRRKPALAGLLLGTAMVALATFAAILWLWRDAAAARGRAEALVVSEGLAKEIASRQRDEASSARAESDRLAAELLLDESLAACERGEVEAGLNGLGLARNKAEAAGLRDIAHACRANIASWSHHQATTSVSPPLGSSVLSVAFSPDGRRVLAGQWVNAHKKAGPGVARLWDPEGWKPVGPALQIEASMACVAFSPDGRRILTGDAEGRVRLWDAATGSPVGPVLRALRSLSGIAFHPDGRRFAAGGVSLASVRGEVCLWEVDGGDRVAASFSLAGPVDAFVFSPDGKTLATASRVPGTPLESDSAEVCRWDLATGQRAGPRLIHDSIVRAIALCPDGNHIATGGDSRVATLWDVSKGRRTGLRFLHPDRITTLAFAPDGKILAVGGGEIEQNPSLGSMARRESSVRLWDIASGNAVSTPLSHPDVVHGFAFAPDGRRIATACRDGHLRVFKLNHTLIAERHLSSTCISMGFGRGGKLLVTVGERPDPAGKGWSQVWDTETGKPARHPLEHPSIVLSLAISADGNSYALGMANGLVRVLDSRSDKAAGPDQMLEGPVSSISFAPGGDLVLAKAPSKMAKAWDWRTGRIAWASAPGDMSVVTAISPDGRMVVTDRDSAGLGLWDIKKNAPAGEVRLRPARRFLSADISPDGRKVIAGDDERVVRCWDLVDGSVTEAAFIEELVWRAAFTGRGARAYAVAGYGVESHGFVYLWDPLSTGPPQRLPYRVNVRTVGFDPVRHLLVTGGWTGGIRLWDEGTGRQIGPELTNAGKVTVLACSPGVPYIATCDVFGHLRIWSIPRD
ncbi:protein kinase domain-containing protein [Singulisphaera sp. PoT]|uniref:protein kinase domain-containing protein n=1 Tax=Singulisphaera sp. PoT TaxID=3411797 RepID=UPI003BF5ECA4